MKQISSGEFHVSEVLHCYYVGMDRVDSLVRKGRDPKRVLSTDFKNLSWVEIKKT